MHIVIVNRWPRFRDERRWDNELTRYEDFFDHQQHQISYVVDAPGAEGVLAPAQQIAHQVQVGDVNQYEQLLAAVEEVIAHVGPVDQLIALSEFRSIGQGTPPTTKFGCGFLPPKIVWIFTISFCRSSASR